MKLPRDVSGEYLVKRLRKIGYEVTRQRGSHVRVTMMLPFGQHHITIPMHNPIKVGTLFSDTQRNSYCSPIGKRKGN